MTHATDPPGTSRNGTAASRMTPEQLQDFEDHQFLDYYIQLPDMHDADERPAFYRLFHEQWMRHVKDIYERRPDLIQGKLATWANTQRALGLWWPDLDKAIRATPTHEVIQLPYVTDSLMPPLPQEAVLEPSLAHGAAPWLEAYCAHSQIWSPRAAEGFHEAVGLWVLSTIAARRLCVQTGTTLYPALYIALVARSTLYAKTTTGKIGRQGVIRGGGEYFLAPDRSTPQALIRNMSGRIPKDYGVLAEDVQEKLRKRHSFAAQRGWYFEEWGGMMAQMARRDGAMADFHSLLRNLDDGYSSYESDTISRGLESVTSPYLALLANATPHDLQQYMKPQSPYWHDGFWPRFAFILPHAHEEPSKTRRPFGSDELPDDLRTSLTLWNMHLGIPTTTVDEVMDARGRPTGEWRGVSTPLPLRYLHPESSVEEAYYTYDGALHDLILRGDVSDDLASCYGRYHDKAMRIATLLASMEACASGHHDDTILLRHWAYAQQVTERWRLMLHELLVVIAGSQPQSPDEILEDKIEEILMLSGAQTARDLQRHIKGSTSTTINRILSAMLQIGRIVRITQGKKILYSLDLDTPENEGAQEIYGEQNEEVF